jgi:hypothetical protein
LRGGRADAKRSACSEGVGWTLLAVAFIQSGPEDLDARSWLLAGVVLSLGAVGAYAALER